MAVSKAAQKATEKYRKKTYDRIEVIAPKGTKERIRQTGKTINGFVNELIEKKLEELGL